MIIEKYKILFVITLCLLLQLSCSVNRNIQTKALNSHFVDIKEFGAIGDGKTDDSEAFKKAIKKISISKQILIISVGVFVIKDKLIIPKNASINIQGIGFEHSILKYQGEEVRAILEYEGGGYLQISNLGIYGNNKNSYAFFCDNITYSYFDKLRIFSCSQAALGIGYGWCNAIRDCLFQSCNNGIELVKGECNGVKVEHCTFLNLDGVGIMFTGTANRAFTIQNCVFESIKKTGIFINASYNINVDNCYFENASVEGFSFSNISKKVKSSIIINGAGTATTAAHAYPTLGVDIKNCFVAPYESESFVYAAGVNGLKINLTSILPKDNFEIFDLPDNQSIGYNKNVQIQNTSDDRFVLKLRNKVESKKIGASDSYSIKSEY